MTLADKINAHLTKGGPVAISTYTKTAWYRRRHAGRFFMAKDGNLHVKAGRSSLQLTANGGQMFLVAVRLYKPLSEVKEADNA